MSGAACTGSSERHSRSRLRTPNKRAADSVPESAATSTAATGMPPEPHEREAVIVARPRSFGHRADRMAPYKMIRHRGTARTVCGDRSERDARLRQAEGTGLSYTVTDRTRSAASQPARAVRGRPRLKQRVEASHLEGNAPPITRRDLVCADERGSGRLAARRYAPDRTTTVRPDSRDFGPPCPAPRGAADDGDAASARGDLADTARPDLGATFVRVGANGYVREGVVIL